jgi:hypothetical protein
MKNLKTQQQIETMTVDQCNDQLALIAKTYDLDACVVGNMPPYVDEVANQLLELEDRITYIRQMASIELANAAKRLK